MPFFGGVLARNEEDSDYLAHAVIEALKKRGMDVQDDDVKFVPWRGDIDYTLAAVKKTAEVITAQLDKAISQNRRLIVIGHSWGAVLAYHALRQSPLRENLRPGDIHSFVSLCTPINASFVIDKWPLTAPWVGVSAFDVPALVWKNYYIAEDPFSSSIQGIADDLALPYRGPSLYRSSLTLLRAPRADNRHDFVSGLLFAHKNGCLSYLDCILADVIGGASSDLRCSRVQTASSARQIVQGKLDLGVVHDCDRRAAHPLDRDSGVAGVRLDAIDAEGAVAACERAVSAFPRVARYKLNGARAAYAAGDVERAKVLLHHAAASNHILAQNVLGYAYLGDDAPFSRSELVLHLKRNDRRAVELFMRTALQGDLYGQAMLGWLFATGRGLRKSEAMARMWWGRAAANRDDRYENMRLYAEERLAELNAPGRGLR
jgi:pimeloyl-ACP methyl ester carboxylesterase